jgi:hypothetical protein
MGITADHQADHDSIEAEDGWRHMLDDAKLWVHLATHHGLRVGSVDNAGLALLLDGHDHAHGRNVTPQARAAMEARISDLESATRRRRRTQTAERRP